MQPQGAQPNDDAHPSHRARACRRRPCAPHSPSITALLEIRGVLFSVLDGVDMPSLARLSQASLAFSAAVEEWASLVAKRDWAAVPVSP